MKRTTLIVMGFLALAVPLGLVSCAPKAAQAPKVLYHCPMHPKIIYDKPGTCKICGMDLVPIKDTAPQKKMDMTASVSMSSGPNGQADTSGAKTGNMKNMKDMPPQGYTQIQVDPRQQQLIGIRLATVERQSLDKQIRVAGEVAHDPELYQAQEEYLKSRGTGLQPSSELKLEHMGMSPAQIKRLERRGHAKRNLIINDQDQDFWIYVYFYEADLPFIQIGQAVEVTVPTMGDERFHGRLQALRPYVDAATRSVRGIVTVRDPDLRLRPGLFVNAQVQVPLPENLVVPLSAILDSGERQIVFVKTGEGVFTPRQVKVLGRAGDFAAVESGVKAGDQVVMAANFMLDSESRLQAVIEEAGTGMAGMHHH